MSDTDTAPRWDLSTLFEGIDSRGVGDRLQHQEKRGIGMIVADRAHRIEAPQVVLIRHVVSAPGNHVERRMIDGRRPEPPHELCQQLARLVPILVMRDGRQEVAFAGQPVGTDRPQVRQAQRSAEVLTDIASCLAVRQIDSKAQAARNHCDLLRTQAYASQFGVENQRA